MIKCRRCGKKSKRLYGWHCWPCVAKCNKESLRRHQQNYPLGMKARAEISRAVNRGELLPAKNYMCVDCGKNATDYDHRDYLKPMSVDPVCRSCNMLRGKAHPYRIEAELTGRQRAHFIVSAIRMGRETISESTA